MSARTRVPRFLSWLIAVAAALVSAASLMWLQVYRDESAWLRSVWTGNDYVTLLVAVPVLVIALVLSARGSRRGELVWYGTVGYMLYNYAYYLLGARINALFPAYVVLWVTSAFVLMMALAPLDVPSLAENFSSRIRERIAAGYMLFTGVGLTFAWLGQWAGIVFGDLKPNLGEAGFQLVAAMDLSFMVPYFVVGAVLLWRGMPWGYVVSPIILVQGALYTLVLAVNSARMAAAGSVGGSELAMWAGWTAAGVVALVLLLSSLREDAV